MLVETKYLGTQEINEEMIIHFEMGLPGFPDENQFIILDIPENELLQIMQSVTNPNLAFFVTNPHYFYQEYTFSLNDQIKDTLQIKEQKEIVILAIMTIKEPFESSTINLQAPVIINSTKMCGKQYILSEEQYPLKARISLTNEGRGE